jgi:hypothetical protein
MPKAPKAVLKQNPEKTAAQPAEKTFSRVFLNDREEGTFTCPACSKGVIRNLSAFAQTRTAIRLKCKCSCGNVYRVLVERRRHFRKPVNLMGIFFFREPKIVRPKDWQGFVISPSPASSFQSTACLTLRSEINSSSSLPWMTRNTPEFGRKVSSGASSPISSD